MAKFQVNIQISAGVTFSQTFTLANPDGSLMDITGFSFTAMMAKHEGAVNAVTSTSDSPMYKYIPFEAIVLDGTGGIYRIGMEANQTTILAEGKYVYNVTMVDAQGLTRDVVGGLAFVSKSFSSVPNTSLDPEYSQTNQSTPSDTDTNTVGSTSSSTYY